jgi:hypothetical protein
MAQRFSAELQTSWAQTRVFDYLADFRNLVDWHPAVQAVELESLDPYTRNARYAVRAQMGGRAVDAAVVAVELERPSLVVATAENFAARTTDRFTIDRGIGQVAVTYETELRLRTPLNVVGPLMVPALTQAWGAAMAELERILSAEAPDRDRPAAAHGDG